MSTAAVQTRGLLVESGKTVFPELVVIGVSFLIAAFFLKVHWTTNFMVFCILVLSYDLLYGYAGYLSFGHMLYFGAGAYAAALWLAKVNMSPLQAIGAGVAVAALTAAILGLIVIRTHGATFALINMAFNEIGYFVVYSALRDYTNGEDGLSCTAGPILGIFDPYNEHYIFGFVLILLLSVFWFLKKLTGSSYGILIRSMKENPKRVSFLGYNIMAYRWLTFVIASSLGGLAGAVFTIVQGFVSPVAISSFANVEIIFAVLIGGAGNLYGALIGGVLFMAIKTFLPVIIPGAQKMVNFTIPQWELWLGIILLIIVFAMRNGVVGFVGAKISGMRLRKDSAGA
jgi:branched-chain amino acid transport system permease protein